jgi:hypothetical protein
MPEDQVSINTELLDLLSSAVNQASGWIAGDCGWRSSNSTVAEWAATQDDLPSTLRDLIDAADRLHMLRTARYGIGVPA